MSELDKDKAIELLNQIMELELAGVVRYTHYALMVFGYSRIPIVSWLRGMANESLTHANEAGELVTTLGGHPSLGIGPLLESHQHDIGSILDETLNHERKTLEVYRTLNKLVENRSIMLEEYSRRLIEQEERHIGEVDKMIRKPGAIHSVIPPAPR